MSKLLPMLEPFEEIKRLYFSTTPDTIERDLARAVALLTRMPTDADRDRVAGYMHGLSDLRREWKRRGQKPRHTRAATATASRGTARSGRDSRPDSATKRR